MNIEQDFDDGTVVVQAKRRWTELFMLLLSWAIGFGGWALTELNINDVVPANWTIVGGAWLAIALVAHIFVRIVIPYADPVILPIAFTLNGLGLAMIHRIDYIPNPHYHRMETQALWTAMGVILFIATLLILRDHRNLQRYPYVLFIVGLSFLLLPLIPGLGIEKLGSRVWIHVGSYTFQPAEVSKVVLAIAFAGYLVDNRDVLSRAGHKILGITLPRARDLGPIAVMWVATMLVIVYQNDLGTGMLFYGMFVVMLYVTTERVGWAILGAVSFIGGAVLAYAFFGHVRIRFDSWLHPFTDYGQNYQIIQAQYGLAWGGLAGRGWGLGRPGMVPLSWSDFIATSIGEELGVTGLMAVIVLFFIFTARGMRTSLGCRDEFGKLMVAGLSFTLALQVFAIIGGVTRLLPLTGLTTPFMSQGGSSLIANWVIVAIIMIVSHRNRKPADNFVATAPNPQQEITSHGGTR
ncbi:FtsW/RodA/SpoVE family cell cycle protein [Cutibacterium sp. WCA-380-WT-3A]|uniref:FtsW/RodA/SpoVE family cell cycle protein n=1 Tax=Cutibacterium porci TaxID=2605781 RepID=A0A7K0J4H7_9ACTN|nr:FtsW/RodA/SpoVE family cell cycle protein [Cutibacterium porci]MSS44834.1 FtsW/RodA/SpoVE family cell cycle protein [Cutibacterium porci]